MHLPDPNAQLHRRRTGSLTIVVLGFWACFALVFPLFMVPLNRFAIPYLDFPLGFFIRGQGAVIAFVIITFWFAYGQDRIDRDHFVDYKRDEGFTR
jgi:putative solute:sodium symporter small subunit